MIRKTKAEKELDEAIAKEYHRRANGVQINIMNICPLFAYVRAAIARGEGLGLAVQDAISKYRELNEVIR